MYINGTAPEGQGNSYLRVINAKNMETMATLSSNGIDWHMPYGFHGQWFQWS